MNIKEAKNLLDLFAAFANTTQETELEHHLLQLHQAAYNLRIAINLLDTPQSVSFPGQLPLKPGQLPLKIISECHRDVTSALDELERSKIHQSVFSKCTINIFESDYSPVFIFEEYEKSLVFKEEKGSPLTSAMALLMFIAKTKGVCRCEVCEKFIIKHTAHNKKTCSPACRQRKRRAKLKLEGE